MNRINRLISCALSIVIILLINLMPVETIAAYQNKGKSVSSTFSYPESPITEIIDTPFNTCCLAGVIQDKTDAPLEDALIEIIDLATNKRLAALLTSVNGKFEFKKFPEGEFALKVSKPGFTTILTKAIIAKKFKQKLELILDFSA